MSKAADAFREAFFRHFSVPRETEEKLDIYARLLREWNEKFNLVAASTIPSLWQRHFLDSAQLKAHIPAPLHTLADLGTGAGFPGIVLAILGIPEVHLIESIAKKARFLEVVAHELGLEVTVHNARVEAIRDPQTDVVTARALKPMPELLSLAKPLTHKDSICLFLKGEQAEAELTEARKYWTFSLEMLPSLSDPSGSVLKIKDLKVRRSHERHHRLPRQSRSS